MDMKRMDAEAGNRHSRKTSVCKILAVIVCFAMMAASISPVTAQAASKLELSLKYKGKTVVIETLAAADIDLDYTDTSGCKQASYKKIKKSFGEARQYEVEWSDNDAFEYKEKGFLFSIEPWMSSADMYSVTIEISSKKAALNGIKVGMSYNKVKKNLEQKYGKQRVITQDDKKVINLTYGPFMPVEYSFKNGKVSSIYFFHS